MRSRTRGEQVADPTTASDEELVELMAALDEAALRELFRRYAPFLISMARRMGFGPGSGELVEEVFVRLWLEAMRFDPVKASARTWIVTTAHRLAVNRIGNGDDFTPDSPSDRLEVDVGTVYVSEALDQLDPLARQLLELAFFGGCDHPRLVEKSGRSPATVKTTMRRALASLHDSVAGGLG